MERFLNEEVILRSRERVRRRTRIFYFMAAAALTVFVVLCLVTRTGNAAFMTKAAIVWAVLSGWAVVAFRAFALEPEKAEESHLTGLEAAEKKVREGRFFLREDSFRIPRSVRVRKVRLESGDETLSLNLNEKLADRMPPDGSAVRVETARKFITAMEVTEAAPEQAPRRKASPLKKIPGIIGRVLLPATLWAMMALILTGFVFNQITDTKPENKITLYADCGLRNAAELAERLEKELGGAVRMVKIHPFTYAMFDSARLKQADLYIIPDSRKEEYGEWLAPEEGTVVCNPDAGTAAAAAWFLYNPEGQAPEIYRLYLGGSSVHLEDGLARKAAELLTGIQ